MLYVFLSLFITTAMLDVFHKLVAELNVLPTGFWTSPPDHLLDILPGHA